MVSRSLQISSDLFLWESSSRMAGPWAITTSRRSRCSTSSSASAVAPRRGRRRPTPKPKKIKHKKKKVKLAVLQFDKVDDGGKVIRLRKECPSGECGAGTFMANHKDQHYCGKCGLTYVYRKQAE